MISRSGSVLRDPLELRCIPTLPNLIRSSTVPLLMDNGNRTGSDRFERIDEILQTLIVLTSPTEFSELVLATVWQLVGAQA